MIVNTTLDNVFGLKGFKGLNLLNWFKPTIKAFIEQHRRSEVAIIKQGPAKRETGESGSCVPGSDVSGATALFNKGYFD